jgi:hypothetical protein
MVYKLPNYLLSLDFFPSLNFKGSRMIRKTALLPSSAKGQHLLLWTPYKGLFSLTHWTPYISKRVKMCTSEQILSMGSKNKLNNKG